LNFAPVANFVANATTGTTGVNISFTDQSTNGPVSWSWSFTGGTPSTSIDQNPTIAYNGAGTFSVTLTATNGCGNNVFTRTNYITITALTTPLVFNGSGSFTVPPGVTCLKVEAWGGGGGGGGSQNSTFQNRFGGGGGGGGFSTGYLAASTGQNYTVTVGAGGTVASNAAGGTGGTTTVTGTAGAISAVGGNGGQPSTAATGGAGGIGNTFTGGAGGTGTSNGAGGGGGAGNASNGSAGTNTVAGTGGTGNPNTSPYTGGNGGAVQTNATNNGSAGIAPGGGGGGGKSNSATSSGGTGAVGRVIITWVNASNFNISMPACTAGVSTVNVTSSTLLNGNYTVTYNTTNPTTTGNVATMTVTGGNGSFSTIAFSGPGLTADVTVTSITFTGWTCSTPLNATASVHILPAATISYAAPAFCGTDAEVKNVNQTGQGGGTYSSAAGLSINNTTGAITPSASTPGSYVVTYSFTDGTCPNTTTTNVIIGTVPFADFSYSNAFYCQAAPTNPSPVPNPLPVFSNGGVAGAFTAVPAGLVFVNAATGQVNLAASAPGTYTVTNKVTLNGCVTTFDAPITINALPEATIAYSSALFCTTSGLQNVDRFAPGFVLGSYTSLPAGLTINDANDFFDPNAGQINPATSTPGVYTVKYTFSDGACSNTITTIVTIDAPANLVVAAQTPVVCIGTETNITVALSNATTSYQLRNNADNSLIGIPVTGNGGTINLPTGPLTTATTFNVFATTAAGCTGQMSATPGVTVSAQPTATAGGNQTICSNGSATVSGASSTNGTISWTHNGAGTLTNATSLTPTYTAALADGGHTVVLTMTVSNSPCTAATATYSILVNAIPTVSLSTSEICLGSSTVLLTPVSGGTCRIGNRYCRRHSYIHIY
jgi:PKD repeat protein